MATSIQIASNRANAQRSTGPRTATGKSASSRNSLRHGLTAKQIVIPGEDPAAYDSLRQELHEDYAPANAAEATLVDQIAEHTWRLQRVRRAETVTFARLMRERDTDRAMSAALIDQYGDLEKIRRYEITIERSYHRALEQLRKLQKERRAFEKESAAVTSCRPAATTPLPQPDAQSGFVSQAFAAPPSAVVLQEPIDPGAA